MPYFYNIQNTDKRYLFSILYFSTKITMCVRVIFYYTANKELVQEIVSLLFHLCLYNKQNII